MYLSMHTRIPENLYISVNRGDVVQGSIAVRKSKKNFRELDVKISFNIKGLYSNFESYQLYKIR